MTSTFHIRDKNTGAFHKEIDYGYGPNYATTPVTLVHTNKGFGKAFKDMAKLKMHLLIFWLGCQKIRTTSPSLTSL